MTLPDVPEQDWFQYQADQFQQQNQHRLDALDFMQRNQARISSLGFEVPEQTFVPSPGQLPTPQLPPLPQISPPTLPQIPQFPTPPQVEAPPPQTPAPLPAPPAPAPTPAPLPQAPTAPAFPAPPTPEQAVAPPTPAPPQGQLTPTLPQTPTVPGPAPAPAPAPQPSVYGQPTPTAPGPFADQTSGGPFATPTQAPTAMPNVQVDSTSPEAFIRSVTPAAKYVESQTGIPAEAMIAMAANETGYGKSAPGNNLFGIKGTGPAGATTSPTWEDYGNGPVQITDKFRRYDDATQSFQDFVQFLRDNPRYQNVINLINSGKADLTSFVQGLKDAGYMTDPAYVGKIQSIANSWAPVIGESTALPKQPSTPTQAPQQTAMNQSQFGDPQLTTDEAYSACGPAAAVRFAQAYGRNPTLREATDLAKQVGWTPGSGMAGIGSEQQLLSKLGIETKLVGPDWSQIAQEAQTGNPVTISTPGHYFYADGYNPQTGQFHVGRSGMDLVHGSEWMTPQQMEQLMGPAQGALFASNPIVAAPSTAAEPASFLDQTRANIQTALGRSPTPLASRTLPTAQPDDPQVQQLNRAVEYSYIPEAQRQQQPGAFDPNAAQPQQPGVVARSGNPLEDLGNTIGQAISRALGAAGLGPPGGPPGNQRRDLPDQNQQDQFSPTTGDVGTMDLGTPSDVGDRARAMIEHLQNLPGGMKLSQVVGVPDLLPPDTRNQSIGDAIREAIDQAGQNALNLPRPSFGPGGLGIYDPRLGADPRMDIPSFLDPIEQVLGDLGRGQTPERVVQALEDAYTGERLTGIMRTGAEDAFRTGGVAAPNYTGDVLGSNVIQQIANDGQQSIANGLSPARPNSAWDNFVRTFVNSNVDLDHVEQDLAQRLGRPLTDEERVGLLARFDPTHQAETAVDMAIGPAMRDVPNSALPDLYNYIQLETDRSAAEGLGKRAEQQALEGGIAQNTTDRLDAATKDLETAQLAHAQALAEQRAVEAGTLRTRESISIDAAQKRVADAQARVEAATEAARSAQSAAAAENVRNMPGSVLTTQAQLRDLTIAESDAQRLNDQYTRLFNRNPDDPYLPRLARQVGVAEDRVSQLRTAQGELSATRGASIEQRAQAAAEAAAARPTVSATPDLAGAKVRLRYEQQNLDRLQAQQAAGRQGLVDDLARAFQRVNKAQRDVDQATADLPKYAAAQGRAARTGRISRDPISGQGINYDQVMQRLQEIQDQYASDPQTWDKFQNVKQALQDFRVQGLREMVDSGMIDQQTMDGLLNTYDFHTPRYMTDYITDANGGLARGSRLSVGDAGLHSYVPEGSAGETMNPIAAVIKEADSRYRGMAKNRLVSALVNAEGGQGGTFRRIADTVKEYVDSGGANGPLLHPDYKPKVGKLGGGEVKLAAMVNGRKQAYVTDNPYIREMVNAAGGETSMLQKILQAPAHIVRETAVQRNPLFLPVNLARDSIAYAVRNTAQSGYRGIPGMAINLGPAALTAATTSNDDPNRGQKIAAALALGMGTRMGLGKNLGLGPSAMRAYLSAMGDVMHGLGTGRMTGEQSAQMFLGGGGMKGGGWFGGGGTLQNADEALRQLTRRNAFTVRNAADLKQLLSDVAGFGWSKALGDRLEMAPRVANMQLALQRGASPLEAAMAARDASVDFNRAGTLTRELNRYVPFFNASVQGTAQLARLMRDNPKGALAAGLTLLGAPAAASEAYNYSDPQRAKDYEDEPQYLKNMGVSLMLPGEQPRDANGNRVPQKLFLPIPQELMPFVIAGREAYKRMAGVGTPMSPGDYAGAASQTLMPLGSSDSPASTIYGLVPAPASTIAQLGLNRDLFRGSTIANQFSDASASNLGKGLAPILERAITQLPGHSADRIHPSQVDFAIRDMGNGLGSTMLNLIDAASGRAPRVPGAPSETPGIGTMIGRFVRGTGGQQWEDVRQPDQMLDPQIRQRLRSLGGSTQYYEPSAVPADINKIPLRQEEQVAYQRLVNQYFNQRLRQYMQTPSFSGRDVVRQKMIDSAMAAARGRAQAEVTRQIRASGSSLAQRIKQQSSAA